jgi:hypothetical protein
MDIGKEHTVKVIASDVAKQVNDMVVDMLDGGITLGILGQVGDAEKFQLEISVEPVGQNSDKVPLKFRKKISILKSLVS